MPTRFAAATSDHRHVLAIAAHGLAALSPRVPRLVGVEFVRRPLRVRGLATLARDLLLLPPIHGRETPIASSSAGALRVVIGITRRVTLSIAVDRTIHAIIVAWSVRHPCSSQEF
jgi:hypothetical protein